MQKGNTDENRAFSVRLYVSDLSYDNEFYDRWYERMPQKRRERADRFKNAIDRHRCIAAYALLVTAVNGLIEETALCVNEDVLGLIRSGCVAICEDEGGKPYFRDIPVCFNISHAGERVAAALSHMDVGCDVEIKNRNALSVAKRFFTDSEYRLLAGEDDENERAHLFTRLWTLKESVVKCCGEGIRRQFDDFSVAGEDGDVKNTVKLSGIDSKYHVREFAGENGYCYSVCSVHDEIEEDIRRINLDQEVDL